MADCVIPEGYKETALGVVPKEWEVKRIKDIGVVVTGSTPATSDMENYGNEYLFVSPVDLSWNKYIYNAEKKLSLKGYNLSRQIPIGAILFTCIGSTIGKMGIAISPLACNQQINAIICNNDVSNEYLFYELSNRAKQIKLLAGEQAVPIVNKSDFENTKIFLPPLPEQQKIAEILNVWDKAIEKQMLLIEKLELRKKGLMQQLLTGKKRLPGFSGEWKKVAIRDYAMEISLKNRQNENWEVLSCTKYDGLVPSLQYFGRQVFSKDVTHYKVVPQYCFAYATNHIEEGSIGYQRIYKNALISPMYTVFKTDNNVIDDIFLYKLLKSHRAIHLYNVMMEGSIDRRGGLRWDNFSTIKFLLPDIKEQSAIADILVSCDNEIFLAKQKLNSFQYQKKGLMQVLLTGKKRVII